MNEEQCEHLWDQWWPQDRTHKYRVCLKCKKMEVREVTK